MDFAACPKCGAMNAPDAETCAECRSTLSAEPDAPPIAFKPDPEAAAPSPPGPPPPAAPAPFDGPPDVQARLAKLEADIAQRPQARALYAQLAQAYVDNGRTDLALAALERGLAIDPHNAMFRHRIAQLTGSAEARVTIPGVMDTSVGGARAAAHPAVAGVPAAAPPRGGATASAAPVMRPAYTARRQLPPRGLSRGRLAAIAGGVLVLVLGGWFALRPSARRIVAGDFRASSPVWSPTGRHLAFLISGSQGSQVGVYDFKAGAHRVVGAVSGWNEAAFSWSPDGQRLAYSAPDADDSEAIHVYDLRTGQAKRLAAGSSPLWRPGGQLIAICSPELPSPGGGYGDGYEGAGYDFTRRFCRIDADSGAVTRTAVEAEWGMAVSPLLDRVVFERSADPAAAAAQAEAAATAEAREFDSMVDNVVAGRASNVAEGSRDLTRELEARKYEQRRKAAAGAEGISADVEVLVADLDRGELARLAPPGQAAYARWTAAGDRILFASNGASGIEFWTARDDGGDRRPLLQGVKVYDPSSVWLSADGRDVFFLAPVAGDPGVARLMTGQDPADLHVAPAGGGKARRLSSRHPFKNRYAVSPDGKRIAYEVLTDVKLIEGAARSEIWVMSR